MYFSKINTTLKLKKYIKESNERQISEFWKTIFFAIVGIPVAVFVTYFGGIVFTIAVVILSSIALIEFYGIAVKISVTPNFIIGIIGNILILITFYIFYIQGFL